MPGQIPNHIRVQVEFELENPAEIPEHELLGRIVAGMIGQGFFRAIVFDDQGRQVNTYFGPQPLKENQDA